MKKKVLEYLGVTMMVLGFTLTVIPKETPEIHTAKWEPIPVEKPAEKHYEEPEQNVYRPYTGARLEVREFSYEEAQMLMRIAQAEAGNQGTEGMKLIMSVVLNRVADEAFPDTIKKVIFQDHQFQPVQNGMYYSVELSPEVHMALADIERGQPLDNQIVAFEVLGNSSLDKYFDYAYTVGDHNFYKTKGEN